MLFPFCMPVNLPIDVLAICVNYRDPAGALAFARSFGRLLGLGHTWRGAIVVADNSAADTSENYPSEAVRAAASLAEPLWWRDSGGNAGYFGGAKAAFGAWVALHGAPKWLLICNCDIRFSDPQFALKLLRIEHAAVVAPQITRTHPSGLRSHRLLENPFMVRRPSARWLRQRQWLCEHYAVYAAYDWLRSFVHLFAFPQPSASGAIYAPHGAMMALHHSFFEAGGLLDHPSFLFAEELYVAEQARALGLTVHFANDIGALHLGSASMGKVASRQQARWGAQSLAAIIARYFSGEAD